MDIVSIIYDTIDILWFIVVLARATGRVQLKFYRRMRLLIFARAII